MRTIARVLTIFATTPWIGFLAVSCGSDTSGAHGGTATGGSGGLGGSGGADAAAGGNKDASSTGGDSGGLGGGGGTDAAAGGNTDASSTGGGDSGGSDAAAGGNTNTGGSDSGVGLDASSASDPNHCGAAGVVCSSTERCINGVCTCAAYYASCAGGCTLTSNDPANCGACNAVCASPNVCSVGACVATCAAGTSPCSGSCVDLKSDNSNCGTCGTVCGSGQGCVNGFCKTADIFSAPAKCNGGSGPPITVQDGSQTLCTGLLAQLSFTWGICSCQDATLSSTLYIDGFDSEKGGYDPTKPGMGGGIGANGQIRTSNSIDVWGQLWADSATNGFTCSAPAHIHQDVHSAGPLAGGTVTVDGDAYVSGNVTGTVSIAGTLYQSPGKSVSNKTTYGNLVNNAIVTVPPPCNCANPIPVASIVAAHSTNNDDALIGLDPSILASAGAPARIDLPCGNYYLKGFSTGAATTIYVHGRTALYIDGDITAATPLTISLDPSAELDIFVSGTVTSSSLLTIGSPNYPANTRLYVGGSNTLALSSNTNISANVWAGNAQVRWSSTTDMFGSIFAGDFTVSAPLRLHHDDAVVNAGTDCPPAGVTSTGDGGTGISTKDGGAKPDAAAGGCNNCLDCGNQACINGACGACTNSAQCCAPLYCVLGVCTEFVGG